MIKKAVDIVAEEAYGKKEDLDVLKVEYSARYCKHSKDEYSISLNVKDTHTSLSTAPYSHCKGNGTEITVFGLSPEDVKGIAEVILEQYYAIKRDRGA